MEKSSLFLFEKRKLIITSVLVTLLLVVCFYSFNFWSFEDKTVIEKGDARRKTASIPSHSNDLNIKAETNTKNMMNSKMNTQSNQTLVWDCQSNVNNLEVSGEYLRLLAKNCDKLRTQILSVKNVTNGYTASLIPTKENVLTTDFLSLRAGKNEIWIETKALGFSTKTYKFNVEKNASVGVREAKE